MSFRQIAHGSFSVEVFGDNHCGPNHDSPKVFEYDVEILYPDEALDWRGFLLDNLEFQHSFQSLARVEVSCERLAQQQALYFSSKTGGRHEQITVGIWAISNRAKVEYTIKQAKYFQED